MSGTATAIPGQPRRRVLLGSAAVGAAVILTSLYTVTRRPIAEAPAWWPGSLCFGNAAETTPAKLRRAQRRERGKLRFAAAPIEPS